MDRTLQQSPGSSSTPVRTVQVEAHLEFIAGFPCTGYGCHGTLVRTRNADGPAVHCSTCEDVYCVLDTPRASDD